jgi:uncharacterized protein (TIGR02646 family)
MPCAYCESKITDTNRQIEHYIPKKNSNKYQEYTLDFENFLLCCKGETNIAKIKANIDDIKSDNLSCGQKKGSFDPKGFCLNPYDLPENPLFSLEIDSKYTGRLNLIPNIHNCNYYNVEVELVKNTILYLNLNCSRISIIRYIIYNQTINYLHDNNINPTNITKNELIELIHTCQSYLEEFYTTIHLAIFDKILY